MSEALEKVLGIKALPLFPLPVVLLPNELMPLHIFEPRYRQMIKDIELTKNLFGLSFFDPQETDLNVPEIGSVGCAAEVREIQMLPDGRSNILAIGIVRYVLEGYVETNEPYQIGEVSFFEDNVENEENLKPLAEEVLGLFMRLADAAQELSGDRRQFPDISQAPPEQLSFLISAAFNFDAELKYEILKTVSTTQRLEKLGEALRQSVGKIEESARIHKVAKTNGHGERKIDI
jgi:ATP-dependent Lon protease